MATKECIPVFFVASATQEYLEKGFDPIRKMKMSISPDRNMTIIRICDLWMSCPAFQGNRADIIQLPDGCPGISYIHVDIIGHDKINNDNFQTPDSRYATVFCNTGYREDDTIELW